MTAQRTLRVLDEAAQTAIEEELVRCADEARSNASRRSCSSYGQEDSAWNLGTHIPWRQTPSSGSFLKKSRPWHSLGEDFTQGQMYEKALGVRPARVVPRLGIFR
jgi:hypothetical protein